jgi:hypothetical protein
MEQLALIDYMVQKRGNRTKTVVMGVDLTWCDPTRETTTLRPFPFWLYDSSSFSYLSGLFRLDSVQLLYRRIKILIGHEKIANQDGFWDYDAERGTETVSDSNFVVPEFPKPFGNRGSANRALEIALSTLHKETAVILVHLPVFVRPENPAHSSNFDVITKCKAEIKAVAESRHKTAIVDHWIDNRHTRNKSLFFDYIHYRTDFAKMIEKDIAQVLGTMR